MIMKEYNESTYQNILSYSTEYMQEILNQFRCRICDELHLESDNFGHLDYYTNSNFICDSCEKNKKRNSKIENILNDTK